MAGKSKVGKNKKRCDAYRTGGHLAINKVLRKKRNEKRVAEFAKRREEGKAYEYKPIPYPKDSFEYHEERLRRAEKNVTRKTPVAKMRSIMAKLENELSKKKAEFKVIKENKSSKKTAASNQKENK